MRAFTSRLFAFALPVLSLLVAPAACAPREVADEAETSEGAFVVRNCVVEQPVGADGYTAIAEADPALVTRKRLNERGELEDDPVKVVRPTAADLQAAMTKISRHLDRLNREVPDSARRRELYAASLRGKKMEPYCMFHAAGRAVYGTVVLFHGFNDRPHQQAKLASYLFHNGFNVYNVFLANMYMVEGTDYWPKTVFRPEVLATLVGKLSDPRHQAALGPILPRLQSGALSDDDAQALDAILAPELSLSMLREAWAEPGGEKWRRLYKTRTPSEGETLPAAAHDADFYEYVRDASARLDEISDLPGPVFVSGLSVGGTVAMAVAAADGGRRVRGVVSHAPWLQSIDPKNNLQVSVAGPLDNLIGVAGGEYPIRWDSHRIAFSPASISATLALGSWTSLPANVKRLATIPTAQVITEDEDSADNAASGKLHEAFSSDPSVAPLHVRVGYPRDLHVRHAITDPENYRDGDPMGPSWNRYWRTLYQESFRFYTTGTMKQENLVSRAIDPALPQPACVMTEFPHRCGQ